MNVREITVNHLRLKGGWSIGKGKARYYIEADELILRKVIFPGIRTMKRLSRKFLKCEYEEDYGIQGVHIFFVIDAGTSKEDRMAFLGAVASHITFEPKEV